MTEKTNFNPLILESIDVDINKLLSFSYTFDNLKKFMKSLIKNQTIMTDKINYLENKLKSQSDVNKLNRINYDNKIKSLEENIIKLNKKLKKPKIEFSSRKELIQFKEKENENDIKLLITKKDNIDIKKDIQNIKKENEINEEQTKTKIEEKTKTKINTTEKEDKINIEQNKNNINITKEEDKINNIQNKNEIKFSEKEDIKKEKINEEENKNIIFEDNKNLITKEKNEEIKIDKDKDEKINEKEEKSIGRESSFSKDIDGESNNVNINDFMINENQEIIEIKNRLMFIEAKLKEYDLSLSQPNFNSFDNISKKDDIMLMKKQIKNIMEKNEENRVKREELKKNIEDLSIKVLDFNIIDILKNVPASNGNQIDVDKLIAINLEQKFQKKTSILDEKTKKAEEEINKIKNNFDNIKINFDVVEEKLNLTKMNIKELKEDIIKSNIEYRNLMTEINNKMHENFLQKIESQKRSVNKNLEQLRQQIQKLNEKTEVVNEDTNRKGSSLSDNDLQYISEMSKKISDLEKKQSLIIRNIETLNNKENNEITKLENELINKINQKDFFELNDKVNLQNTISNNIREMVERVQEITNKNMKDLNFFLRKIESLSGSVISMQNFLESVTGSKQETSIDFPNYLEQESFNEYLKTYHKDKKDFERNMDDFRRIVSDITEILKSKPSEKDLKDFEIIINNKIEEVKINCGRKFADKIDTVKSFKFLDTEIKYIKEQSIKKDKNEGWLLAKKPVGGFSCASCESYIGDLKEKGDYIVWNKYPQREKNVEKNYRVGNGFSRMLNMLNLDIKNSLNNFDVNSYESDDEDNINQKNHIHHQTNNTINFNISQGMKTSTSHKKRNSLKKSINQLLSKNSLPKINSVDNILNNEKSLENFGMKTVEQGTENSSQNHIGNENKKPHIVKVFKKNK